MSNFYVEHVKQPNIQDVNQDIACDKLTAGVQQSGQPGPISTSVLTTYGPSVLNGGLTVGSVADSSNCVVNGNFTAAGDVTAQHNCVVGGDLIGNGTTTLHGEVNIICSPSAVCSEEPVIQKLSISNFTGGGIGLNEYGPNFTYYADKTTIFGMAFGGDGTTSDQGIYSAQYWGFVNSGGGGGFLPSLKLVWGTYDIAFFQTKGWVGKQNVFGGFPPLTAWPRPVYFGTDSTGGNLNGRPGLPITDTTGAKNPACDGTCVFKYSSNPNSPSLNIQSKTNIGSDLFVRNQTTLGEQAGGQPPIIPGTTLTTYGPSVFNGNLTATGSIITQAASTGGMNWATRTTNAIAAATSLAVSSSTTAAITAAITAAAASASAAAAAAHATPAPATPLLMMDTFSVDGSTGTIIATGSMLVFGIVCMNKLQVMGGFAVVGNTLLTGSTIIMGKTEITGLTTITGDLNIVQDAANAESGVITCTQLGTTTDPIQSIHVNNINPSAIIGTTTITALLSQIAALQASVTALQASVTALQATVTTHHG